MSTNNSSLSGGLSFANLLVSASCLSVSAFQAGLWILDVVPNQRQAAIMVGGILAILIGSQVIARMVGQAFIAKLPLWACLMGILCIGAIEVLSVSTSTTAFASNIIDSRRTQNVESAEYRMAMQDISNYQRQINALSTQLETLPATYVTKRQQVSSEIRELQASKERIQDDARSIDVSVSGAAFDGLESNTGLSSSDVSLIAAILLSIVPLVCNILAGAFGWTRREKVEVPAPKKPQARRKLRAV